MPKRGYCNKVLMPLGLLGRLEILAGQGAVVVRVEWGSLGVGGRSAACPTDLKAIVHLCFAFGTDPHGERLRLKHGHPLKPPGVPAGAGMAVIVPEEAPGMQKKI